MFKKFLLVVLLMVFSNSVLARSFWHHGGYVTRVLSEGPYFGGCMIKVSDVLPVDCDAGGVKTDWVSLDCDKKFYSDGPRKYSTALMAMSTNMRISLFIDTTKKHAGHCVVRRMDIYK